ncbi:hypothetical protein FQA39_LY08839 [Lamprigera yunnana]|nr:hypothetical protein FQA39_LY08839 [Lamprigera yunnana]
MSTIEINISTIEHNEAQLYIPIKRSDKSPAAAKRRKLENLTQIVQQLQELSQNIQSSSNNEHEAFGNFVGGTLTNLYNNSLQSPYSNHYIDGYPHQQYNKNTNSTFYSDKHTNAPQQTNIEGQSLNLDATSLANEHINDDSIISQALSFI